MAAIMLVIALLGLAATYGVTALLHHEPAAAPPSDAGPRETRTLLGKTLDIPASWFRDATPAGQGFSSQIDLRLELPLGHNGALRPIEVMLLPLSQVRASASLLDGVYLHQFLPEELSGPAGLVGKPLDDTEGYANETVWYDALSPDPFVAKCMAAPDDTGPAECLRTVALGGGIAAVYSFPADVLDDWKQFDPQMRTWLARIGAL